MSCCVDLLNYITQKRTLSQFEVAIGPVTGPVLQSYRSGSHVKLNLEARAQCYNQVIEVFVFV